MHHEFKQNMVCKHNSCYQIPSKWHFADFETPRLYSDIKGNIVVVVSLKDAYFFVVTTNIRTSGTCHPYLTLTVHFINPE